MAHGVKRIYIAIMKEAEKGLSYWVEIEREDGGHISPFMSYFMDRAIYMAAEWAHFFGIQADIITPIESMGLTQEAINKGYAEAEFMVNMLETKDWKY